MALKLHSFPGTFIAPAARSWGRTFEPGIPDSRRVENGDIVNIDITAFLDRVHGDTNVT